MEFHISSMDASFMWSRTYDPFKMDEYECDLFSTRVETHAQRSTSNGKACLNTTAFFMFRVLKDCEYGTW